MLKSPSNCEYVGSDGQTKYNYHMWQLTSSFKPDLKGLNYCSASNVLEEMLLVDQTLQTSGPFSRDSSKGRPSSMTYSDVELLPHRSDRHWPPSTHVEWKNRIRYSIRMISWQE
jgi:hypothetical protein